MNRYIISNLLQVILQLFWHLLNFPILLENVWNGHFCYNFIDWFEQMSRPKQLYFGFIEAILLFLILQTQLPKSPMMLHMQAYPFPMKQYTFKVIVFLDICIHLENQLLEETT
jgi:hypothetical protein